MFEVQRCSSRKSRDLDALGSRELMKVEIVVMVVVMVVIGGDGGGW